MFFRPVVNLFLTTALLHLPLALSGQVYTTSYGGSCTGPCQRKDTEYYWCKQAGGSNSWWDYCSPKEGYDSYYRLCLSKCKDSRDSGYEQCATSQGWRTCGHVVQQLNDHYTSYNKPCATECYFDEGYFTCTDIHRNKGNCSPLKDVTANGVPCREDHPCDTHSYSYTWCYTDYRKNWDYCGIVESECKRQSRRKRVFGDNEVCLIPDPENGGDWKLTKIALNSGALLRPSRSQYKEALQMISDLNVNSFYRGAGTISRGANIRVDMQGAFQRNGVTYRNVQLQINEQRRSGSSTSIAQIIFPEDMNPQIYSNYIKESLYFSLLSAYNERPVRIEITRSY